MWRLGHCKPATGRREILTQTSVSQHKPRNCLITPAGYILPPSTSQSPSHITSTVIRAESSCSCKVPGLYLWICNQNQCLQPARGKWLILPIWAVQCLIQCLIGYTHSMLSGKTATGKIRWWSTAVLIKGRSWSSWALLHLWVDDRDYQPGPIAKCYILPSDFFFLFFWIHNPNTACFGGMSHSRQGLDLVPWYWGKLWYGPSATPVHATPEICRWVRPGQNFLWVKSVVPVSSAETLRDAKFVQ